MATTGLGWQGTAAADSEATVAWRHVCNNFNAAMGARAKAAVPQDAAPVADVVFWLSPQRHALRIGDPTD